MSRTLALVRQHSFNGFSSLAQPSAAASVLFVVCVTCGSCPEGKALVVASFASSRQLGSLLIISFHLLYQIYWLYVYVEVVGGLRERVCDRMATLSTATPNAANELISRRTVEFLFDFVSGASSNAKRIWSRSCLFTLCYLSALALYHCLCCSQVTLAIRGFPPLSRQAHYCAVFGTWDALSRYGCPIGFDRSGSECD